MDYIIELLKGFLFVIGEALFDTGGNDDDWPSGSAVLTPAYA